MKAQIASSHGMATFDCDTGLVEAHDLGPDFGPKPYKFDVEEWRKAYPGESMEGIHDILDFGYWYRAGKHESYMPPDKTWRAEFAKGRAK